MARNRRRRTVVRNVRFGRTILRQVLLCILLLLIIIAAKKMDTAIVKTTYNVVKSQFTRHTTVADISNATKNMMAKFKDGTVTVVASLTGGNKGLEFTMPADADGTYSVSSGSNITGKTMEFYSDKEMQVYAAAGGTVSEIGRDAGGNIFVKIYHGNDLSSLYGGCTSSYVQALEKVKRGQIIGSVASGDDHVFRFEIWDKGKLADPAEYMVFK